MARWLSGELSKAEQAEFEASSEYAEYQRLAEGLQAFQKPVFDKESLRERIWEGIENQKPTKVVRLRPLYYSMGIAASLLLLFGLFFNRVTYSSEYGEKMAVVLPDGSQVTLNAGSTLSHKRFFWMGNKKVELSGEAFFNISKGDGFKVITESGSISVLGTQFNVRARKAATFELYCYEGKVRYENEPQSKASYLEQGDAIQLKDNVLTEFKHSDNAPAWQEGRSTFSNAKLLEVIQELEYQYGIKITYGATPPKGHFSGTFVHNDITLALKSVLVPMGITYELSEDKKTVTLDVP